MRLILKVEGEELIIYVKPIKIGDAFHMKKNFSQVAKTSKKLSILLVSVLLVALLLTTSLAAYSAIIAEAGDSPMNESAYTVWSKSGLFYAQEEYSNEIISNNDFASLMTALLGRLPDIYVQLPNPEADWVTAKTGRINILAGDYPIYSSIHVPLGSVIRIEGVSSNQEFLNNGMKGGTQFLCYTNTSSFVCNSNNEEVSGASGTQLTLKYVQFVQMVNLEYAARSVLNLDGMARGILEDVVVTKSNTKEYPCVGTGIRHTQFEDAGGYTTYRNVQVMGFSVGLDVRINHWAVHQLGIGNCTLGLNWQVCMGDNIYNLHCQEVDQVLKEWEGFGEPQIATIFSLYLERCGRGTALYKWENGGNFDGLIKIYETNTFDCGPDIWTWNEGFRHWFVDVFPAGSSPLFPSPVSPPVMNNTDIRNREPQEVIVYVWGGEVSDIKVNGVSTHQTSGTFFLRPSDQIALSYSVAPEWSWQPYSAGHMMIND
jgi:hypothetical protein